MDGNPNRGIFNPANLNLYTYSYSNPVNLVDPDGEFVWFAFMAVGAAITAYDTYNTYNEAGGGTEGLKAAGQALAIDGTITIVTGGVGKVLHSGYKAYKAGKGSVATANFAQSTIRKSEQFSKEGIAHYSKLAGEKIESVNDLAKAIKSGKIKPNQVPVDYVINGNGKKLILNTRTSVALDRAGVAKKQWYGNNKTGQEAYEGTTFDDLAQGQLKRNDLPADGTSSMPKGRE